MRLLSLGALTLMVGAVGFTGTAGALALPPAVPGTVINTGVTPTIPVPSLTAPIRVITKPVVKTVAVKKVAVKKGAVKKTSVRKKTTVHKH